MPAPYFSFIDPSQADPEADPLAAYAPSVGAPATPMGAKVYPTQRPGWAARLFGGADPLQGGLLSPQDASGIGRQSLRDFGINLLQNSGPSPYKRGLGELLGTALNAGQQAYQQGTAHALSNEGVMAQRQNALRVAALHQRFAGRTDPQSLLEYMNGLIGVGTPEAVRSASAISEYLKSQRGENGVRGVQQDYLDPVTHKRMSRLVNPVDGSQIGQPVEVAAPASSGSGAGGMTDNEWRQAGQDFTNHFLTATRQKAIDAANLFYSHLAQARAENPTAYKPLLTQFMQSSDAGAQLRVQMYNILADIDPSLSGRIGILARRVRDATWDPALMDDLQRTIDGNVRSLRNQYTSQVEGQLRRHPNTPLGQWIPKPEEIFGPLSSQALQDSTETTSTPAQQILGGQPTGRPPIRLP